MTTPLADELDGLAKLLSRHIGSDAGPDICRRAAAALRQGREALEEELADFICDVQLRLGPGCDELAIAQAISRKYHIALTPAVAPDGADEAELFAAATKIDLADAVKHLRDWMSYIDDHHRQKYADLLEAQAKLIAWLVQSRLAHARQAAGQGREANTVAWQYRVKFDKGHARENEWLDWRETSKAFYDKCCAEIAAGNTRLQARALTPAVAPDGAGEDDLCQCPKCGRMHRGLGAGKPPAIISGEPT